MDDYKLSLDELYKLIPMQMIGAEKHPKVLKEIAKVLDKVAEKLIDIEVDLDYLVDDEKEEFKEVQRDIKKISDELLKTAAKYEVIFNL